MVADGNFFCHESIHAAARCYHTYRAFLKAVAKVAWFSVKLSRGVRLKYLFSEALVSSLAICRARLQAISFEY